MKKFILTALLPLAMLSAPFTLATEKKSDWEIEWEAKALAFAKTELVVNAMQEFNPAFTMFREENGLESVADLKGAVVQYYTEEYGKEYADRNGEEVADMQSLIDPLDDDSIALQYYYIAANPNPLGAKGELKQADDKSTWSQLHGKYHEAFRTYLQEEGLYDIFLVDLVSGDIVYSVFKELDFSTSLLDGPYAQTNFGDAFRAAKEATDKEFSLMVFFQPYLPSYEDPAYFVAAPVYSGADKVGVLVMQLPF